MALVEQVTKDIVTIPADWSIGDAYSKLSGNALCVEPLSARQSLADFILGGGLGWGSLRNGSFASKLYKVQTDKFTFGSNFSTSVNAGYPLHRLVEGMPHDLCPDPNAEILRITVPTCPKPQVKAVFRPCSVGDAVVPVPADNFIWVNDAAASSLGVSASGSIAFFERFEPEGEGEPVDGVYEKRFFEDSVPPGQVFVKVLTIKSNLPALEDLAKKSGRFFICLWTHLGVLACISTESAKQAEIEREAAKLPLTFNLPKKGGGPRQYSTQSPVMEENAAPEPEKAEKPAKPSVKEPEKPAQPEVKKTEVKKEEPSPPAASEQEKTPPVKEEKEEKQEKEQSTGQDTSAAGAETSTQEPDKPSPESGEKASPETAAGDSGKPEPSGQQ